MYMQNLIVCVLFSGKTKCGITPKWGGINMVA